MTDSAALQLGKNGVEFTIGCWFKTSTAAGAKNIFQSFSLNTNYAGLYLDVNGTNLRLATGNNTGPAVASTITGATTVTDGNWHYAVATFRNNFGQLYLDGKLEASGYMITPAFAATNYVRVGCGNLSGSNVNWFNGQIDDLFLINGYALDEQTIAAKYGASPQTAQGTNDITITKKALVSTNAVLSDSDTLITIFSGTDYTAANSAITSPYYSPLKAPYGFPLSHEKWTVEYRLTDGTQGTPTQNQWYNLASNVMALPIGAWDVSYKFQLYANKGGSTFTAMNATLATAPNVETDPRFTTMVFGTGDPALGEVYMALPMSVKAKTNLYPNFKTGYASIGQILLDAAMPNLIRAKSALL
jgi:hypothetical protein